MGTRIEVRRGPDAGRTYEVTGDVVRVGRGPGSDLQLTDPGLQGRLKVEYRNGAHQVVNEMAKAIYLNGEVFPKGARRTWFHGHALQPTADTELVLVLGAAARDDGRPKPAPSGRGKAYQAAGVVACFAAALVLFVMPSSGGDDPGGQYERVHAALAQKPELADLLKKVRDARYLEARGYPRAAAAYRAAREEAQARSAGKAADSAEVLALNFVNQRLEALSQRQASKGR